MESNDSWSSAPNSAHTNDRGKTIISIFRWFLSFDSYYEEINALQAQKAKIDANNILNEEIEKPKEAENEMDIDGFENLPKLFIKPTEKLMDEFTGSVKSCRGLFKIPKTNVPTGNLHQQI